MTTIKKASNSVYGGKKYKTIILLKKSNDTK